MVKWIPPETDWLKGDTDGAFKGNLGLSSIAFYIRDQNSDLVVQGSRI